MQAAPFGAFGSASSLPQQREREVELERSLTVAPQLCLFETADARATLSVPTNQHADRSGRSTAPPGIELPLSLPATAEGDARLSKQRAAVLAVRNRGRMELLAFDLSEHDSAWSAEHKEAH
jgi:hypothetical protein